MRQYSVAIYPALPKTGAQIAAYDLNPDITQLSWSTALPGGFGAADVGMRDPKLPQWGYLPRPADITGLCHVRIRAGSFVCFEGQVMIRRRIAGAVRGFTADGYGVSGTGALNDDYYVASNGTGTTAGTVLQSVIADAAPLITIPNLDLWQDSGVSHIPSDFDGMSPDQVIGQLAKEGGGAQDSPWDFSVWDDRTARWLPRIAPDAPDYLIDPDDDLEIDEDFTKVCTSAATVYTPAGGTKSSTSPVTNSLTVDRYGRVRRILLQGSTMGAPAALQLAETYLTYNSGPRTPMTIRLPGGRGLRRPGGAETPPHRVRAGQWVQLGQEPMAIIVATDFDANTDQLTVTAQDYPRDYYNAIAEMERQLRNLSWLRNPQSGAPL